MSPCLSSRSLVPLMPFPYFCPTGPRFTLAPFPVSGKLSGGQLPSLWSLPTFHKTDWALCLYISWLVWLVAYISQTGHQHFPTCFCHQTVRNFDVSPKQIAGLSQALSLCPPLLAWFALSQYKLHSLLRGRCLFNDLHRRLVTPSPLSHFPYPLFYSNAPTLLFPTGSDQLGMQQGITDWLLITGREGLHNRKIAGLKMFASPIKSVDVTPFKNCRHCFSPPSPTVWLKLKCTIKTTSKPFVFPTPLAWLKLPHPHL